MPYVNIVWIKLFLELFDGDDRFLYKLTERQQLLYIKLLYLAGRQKNKISKTALFIIQKTNYQGTTQDLTEDIKKIKNTFKKFKETRYYYTFTKFNELHNQIRDGIVKGKPQDSQRALPDKSRLDKSRLDKDKEKDKDINYQLSDFLLYLILKRKPTFKVPNMKDWTKQIDLMIRIDKRDSDDILKVIKWCQQDDFWQNNILSTAKLRKQFDQLELKMKAEPKPFSAEDLK